MTTFSKSNDGERKFRRRRRFLRGGQAIMIIGFLVGDSQWIGHLGAFGDQPPGWMDLAIGYPAAGILIVAGAIIASQK